MEGAFRGLPEPLQRLIEELTRLPGVGPKTASRLAFFLLKAPRDQVVALADALRGVKEEIRTCSRCFTYTVEDPCPLCRDPERDPRLLCVVEEPLDLVAIERTGQYRGLYHVLGGALSPVDGVGPEDLRIQELVERVRQEPFDEVILATNPNLEGEATALYIARLLIPLGVRVTRIAHGLPMGGDLEYADEVTLARALEGRRDL